MRIDADETLLQDARDIGPLIREHAPEAERERRLSRAVVDAMTEAGCRRLYVPKALGGLEVDPVTCTRVVEEVSTWDSAAGWAVMVANSIAWWCARLPGEGAREIYARGADSVIASAFHPPVEATAVLGGYRLSGRRGLASNVHDATWILLTALVVENGAPRMVDGSPEVIGAVFDPRECRIHDTWYAMGMRGTDSNDIEVTDVFVPTSRTFQMVPNFEPGPDYAGPLYRMPAMGAAVGPWAAVALSVARRAIDEVCTLAGGKTPLGSTTVLKNRASAQLRVGRAEATLRSARVLLYDELQEAWTRTLAGEPSTLEHKADLLMAATHAMQASAEVVQMMYGIAGTSAIYSKSPIERCFRDSQVMKQHGFYSESRYETVGQVRLGVTPDFGFVAF